MTPFTLEEEGTETAGPSERLIAFNKQLWEALVPARGEAESLQGELVRGWDRLYAELLRNGLSNYYVPGQTLAANHYGRMMVVLFDTLAANKGAGLTREEAAWFASIRDRLEGDFARVVRLSELEDDSEGRAPLTPEETEELQRLLDEETRTHLPWEAIFRKAQRCVLNWCLANPNLVDLSGKPMKVRGLGSIDEILKPPPELPKCPLCNGRGFIQPKDERLGAQRCICQNTGRGMRY